MSPDFSYVGDLGDEIIGTINGILVPVLFAVAFIVFIFGVFKTYIFSHGEPAEVAKGHKLILWGLIGFVVMLSILGIIFVLTDALGWSDTDSPILEDLPQGPEL